MKFIHLSDTHGKHHELPKLPSADLIIHSGDVSMAGTGKEVMGFIDWFGALNYKYKIFIGGNHDFCLDGKARERIQKFLPSNMHYLYDSGVEIDGIQFWGIPYFVSCKSQTENYYRALDTIHCNTDVLITHSPPFGILDRANNITYGCPDLLEIVLKIKPKYHLFGHIHDAYGVEKSTTTTFVNGAMMNEDYRLVNEARMFVI
ncbi:metallophosphoesterase [Bacteroidia bacterium]|nr:metallophosphoesterase [Bacteroidia bacterium]